MAAAAEFFRERRQVLIGGGLIPRVGAQGNFRARGGGADADGINTFRVQQIRYEFVVALKVEIANVEKNDAIARFDAFAQNFDGAAVALEERAKMLGHQRELHHFTQRAVGQLRNDARRQAVFRRGFNHQGELRGRLGKLDGRLRRRILRSVNDVAPVDQVRERLGIEAELFAGNGRDELGAGLVLRLVKHVRTRVRAELLGVGRGKKGALVMVEPPGHFRGVGKFEIHDDVLVAIEEAGFPGLRGPVGHAREAELRVLVEAFAIKTVKESGGSSAIKAAIVKAEPDLGHKRASSPLRIPSARGKWRRSQPRCTWTAGLSSAKACDHRLAIFMMASQLAGNCSGPAALPYLTSGTE